MSRVPRVEIIDMPTTVSAQPDFGGDPDNPTARLTGIVAKAVAARDGAEPRTLVARVVEQLVGDPELLVALFTRPHLEATVTKFLLMVIHEQNGHSIAAAMRAGEARDGMTASSVTKRTQMGLLVSITVDGVALGHCRRPQLIEAAARPTTSTALARFYRAVADLLPDDTRQVLTAVSPIKATALLRRANTPDMPHRFT